MNFELPVLEKPVTKELLLQYNSEETYMSTYLAIPVTKGLVVSPLRKDRKPTASFYRNKKKELIFHDFGSDFHGNFVSVVMFLYKLNFTQALRKIAADFGIIQSDSPVEIKIRKSDTVISEKKETLIQVETQPFTEKELLWWNSFGVSLRTLKKFHVFSCKSIFLNGHYFKSSSSKNMIFGYYGGKRNNDQLWRLYFPQASQYRFLSNWSKSMIQGIKFLPNNLDTLVITKSLKDVMCLYEHGITAIAPCSENTLIEEKQFKKIMNKYKNIFILYDNDKPGVVSAHAYKKKYPNIKCIFIKRKYAKDISDLHKLQDKQCFNKAISELNTIFSNPGIFKTDIFYVF